MTDYKIVLTDKYLKEGQNFFLAIEENGKAIKPGELINNLVSIPLDKAPEFMESILNEKDYSQIEYSWILFGEVKNDDNEIFVPIDKVGFSLFDDVILISKKDFFQLCIEVIEKFLEAVDVFSLKEKGIVDDEWIIKMGEFIPRLNAKVKNV